MKNIDNILIGAGIVVLAIDIVTGYMKAKGTPTPIFDTTLGILEDKVPVPLWMGLVGMGIAIKVS